MPMPAIQSIVDVVGVVIVEGERSVVTIELALLAAVVVVVEGAHLK